jgi:hypothetical protein
VGAVGDAVDDGGGESRVGEGLVPFGERGVTRHGHGRAFLAFGEDLEEQFGGAFVEVDVAEFIDREEVVAAVAGDDACEVMFVGCFGEFVGELRAGGVAGASSGFGGGEAGPDEEVAFAGSSDFSGV